MILLDAPQGPAERRYFVHKRILGGVKGFVTGGFTGAAVGFLTASGRQMTKGEIRRAGLTAPPPPALSQPVVVRSRAAVPQALAVPSGPCPGIFQVKGPGGTCIDLTALPPGGDPALTPRADSFGEAVLGRYGSALAPAVTTQLRMMCPRGTVLGNDDLCYNRRDLKKSERKWIPERKPLLTGGDLNAITRARKAGRAVAKKTMWLQEMGMLPKPAAKRRSSKKHAHAVPAPAVSV